MFNQKSWLEDDIGVVGIIVGTFTKAQMPSGGVNDIYMYANTGLAPVTPSYPQYVC